MGKRGSNCVSEKGSFVGGSGKTVKNLMTVGLSSHLHLATTADALVRPKLQDSRNAQVSCCSEFVDFITPSGSKRLGLSCDLVLEFRPT